MVDRVDEQLVQIIGRDAWQSSEAIAKQLKISSSTVRRRLRKLIQSGAVSVVAVVDPTKFSLPLNAVIAFDVAHGKIELVLKALSSRPEVKWLSTTTGRFDILAFVCLGSTDELSNFVQKEVANIEGLQNTETFVCLHVDKGRYVQL